MKNELQKFSFGFKQVFVGARPGSCLYCVIHATLDRSSAPQFVGLLTYPFEPLGGLQLGLTYPTKQGLSVYPRLSGDCC